MIVLYSGTPGSGKSLDTARTIYNWCRRGAPIICNFPLNADNIHVKRKKDIHFIPNGELDPDELVSFSRTYFAGRPCKEDSILLVIDEARQGPGALELVFYHASALWFFYHPLRSV